MNRRAFRTALQGYTDFGPAVRDGGSAGASLVTLPTDYTYHAVYSLHLCVSGYEGAIAAVCATSDTATPASPMDVYPNADGTPDLSAAVSAFGSSFDVYKLYDQTGNHDPAIQSTKANRPRIVSDIIGGYQAIYGTKDGTGNLSLPATVTVSRRAMTDIVVAAGPNQVGSGNALSLIGHSTTNSTSNYVNFLTGERGVLYLAQGFVNGNRPIDSVPSVVSMVGGASNTKFFRNNEAASSVTVMDALTDITGGWIGRCANTNYNSYEQRYYAHIIAQSAIADADIAIIHDALMTKFGIKKSRIGQVWMAGDSLIFGQEATNGRNEQYYLEAAGLSGDPYIFNLGRPGVTAQATVAVYSQAVCNAIYRSTMSKNVAVLGIGSNDINAGRTATQVWTDLTTISGRLLTAGFNGVLIRDIIKRAGFDGTQESSRLEFNGMAVDNAESAGVQIIEASALDDTLSFAGDGIHLTSTGYSQLAALATPLLNDLLS